MHGCYYFGSAKSKKKKKEVHEVLLCSFVEVTFIIISYDPKIKVTTH